MLLHAGAETDRAATDGTGRAPLHLAAEVGATKCARLLLAAGADPVVVDAAHRSPLDYAHNDTVRTLLMHELLTRRLQADHIAPSPSATAAALAGGRSRVHGQSGMVLPAQVRSRGPVRELTFYSENDRTAAASARADTDGGEGGEGGGAGGAGGAPTLRFEASFTMLGLTLIDEEPAEVMHLALQRLIIRGSRTPSDLSIELKIGRLQIDSCVPITALPVLLSPKHDDEDDTGESVHFSLSLDPRWEPALYVNYVGAALQPLCLELEQNTVTRLLRLLRTVETEWARVDDEQAQLREAAAGGAGGCGGPAGGGAAGGDDAADDDLAVWSSVDEVASASYIRELHLEPVVLTATVSIAALCDEPHLQEFHPTQSLRSQFVKQLTSLHNVTLSLDAVEFLECAEDVGSIVQRLQGKYAMEVLQQLHKLVGSLDLLGNPAALFADVRGGVKTFFREPNRDALHSPNAFVKGVAEGVVERTGGLVGGVIGGGASAGASIFSAGFKIGVIGFSNMSGDAQYARRRQLAAQRKATGVKQGLRMGTEALRDGVTSGLYVHPHALPALAIALGSHIALPALATA